MKSATELTAFESSKVLSFILECFSQQLRFYVTIILPRIVI